MKQVYKTFNPPLPLTERPQFGRMVFNGEIEVQSHHKDGKWKRRFAFLHQQVLILCKCDGEVNYVREILDVDKLVVGRVQSTDNVEKYTNRFMLIATTTRTPMAARTTTTTASTTKTSPTEATKSKKLENEIPTSTSTVAMMNSGLEETTTIVPTAATENKGFESETETITDSTTTSTNSTTTEATENDGAELETQPQTETLMVQTRRAVAWIEALEGCISVVVRNDPCISCRCSSVLKLTTFDEGESCDACGKLFQGLISQGYQCSNCNLQTHGSCLTHCTDLDADDV